jgi:hypothetical protein
VPHGADLDNELLIVENLIFHANILPIPNRGSLEHFKFIELSSRMLVALAKKKSLQSLVGGSKERS